MGIFSENAPIIAKKIQRVKQVFFFMGRLMKIDTVKNDIHRN